MCADGRCAAARGLSLSRTLTKGVKNVKWTVRTVMRAVSGAAAGLALSELALGQVVVTASDAVVQASGFITNNLGQSTNNTKGGAHTAFGTLNQSHTNPLSLPAGQQATSSATQMTTIGPDRITGLATTASSITNVPMGLVVGVSQGISQLSVNFTVPGPAAVRGVFADGAVGTASGSALVQVSTADGMAISFNSDDNSNGGNFTGVAFTLPPGDYQLVATASGLTDIQFAGGVPTSAQWRFDLGLSTLPACRVDYDGNFVLNPDDLGDFIRDYFEDVPIPGPGGFAGPCPENGPPYDAGYRMAYTSDGSVQCHPPFSDNVGDFVRDYFEGCEGY